MRLPGFCTGCRKIKTVVVNAVGLASIASGGTAQGTCLDCRDKEDAKRREARRFS